MARDKFVVQIFPVNLKCYSRVHYFITRLKSILPRMERILHFEYTAPGRGIKKQPRDDAQLETIKSLVIKFDLKFMSLNKHLLEDVCADPFFRTQLEGKENTETSCRSVKVVLTTEKTLHSCLDVLASTGCAGDAVLAILIEKSHSGREDIESAVKDKLKVFDVKSQLVVIEVENNTDLDFLSTLDCSKKTRNSEELQASRFHVSRSSSLKKVSCAETERPSLAHSHDDCPTCSITVYCRYCRSLSRPYGSDIKRPKLSCAYANALNPTIFKKDFAKHRATKYKPLNTGDLKKAISLRLESIIVDVIEKILNLLQSVRNRRDKEAVVSSVTTLDKLIFEVEGLLAQSVTEAGVRMKMEIEEAIVSQDLKQDVLSIDGVYGCGTLYNRLCVHIDSDQEEHKEQIREQVKELTRKHNYTKAFDVQAVISKPQWSVNSEDPVG